MPYNKAGTANIKGISVVGNAVTKGAKPKPTKGTGNKGKSSKKQPDCKKHWYDGVVNGAKDIWHGVKVSSKAYTEMAIGTGDTYFDLGAKWGEIEKSYGLTDRDMFELFNQSALDDAVTKGKTIRFSQDPTAYGECALKSEWDYLVCEHGYTRLKQIGDYWYAK